MTLQLTIRNRATQDIRQQANYILGQGNRDAAERFLECTELTFSQLQITPNIGKLVTLATAKQGEIRQWRIKHFKDFLIFYKVQVDRVDILRVLHGVRDLEGIIPFLEEDV